MKFLPPMEAIVVKLGGSLMGSLSQLIPLLSGHSRPLLIVPGGGIFAQCVRDMGADGEAGHWMALAAMEQYGWLISSYGVPVTDALISPDQTFTLLPYRVMRDEDPLPHTWNITSDTIAAWVASRLGLSLVVLKSVDGITSGGRFQSRLNRSIPCSEVDPCFLSFVLSHNVPSTIINGQVPERVKAVLDGKETRGTLISTSF